MLNPSVKFLLIGDQPKCLGPLRKQQFGVAGAKQLAGGLAEVTSRHVGLVLMTLIAACTLQAADHPDFPRQIQQTRTNAVPHGAIGVGAWNTSVEYKDIVVTSNGVVLYRSDFEKKGTTGWSVFGGTWSVQDGVLRQSSIEPHCRLIVGNSNWNNCTISLRARKTGGEEGFNVYFHWLDGNNWSWFNVGGYTNTLASVDQSIDNMWTLLCDKQVPLSVETNIWYDLRVVIKGASIAGYVNSRLVVTGDYNRLPAAPPTEAVEKATPNSAPLPQPANPVPQTSTVPQPNPSPTKASSSANNFLHGAMGVVSSDGKTISETPRLTGTNEPIKSAGPIESVKQVLSLSGTNASKGMAFHAEGWVVNVDPDKKEILFKDATGAIWVPVDLNKNPVRLGASVALDGKTIAEIIRFPDRPSGSHYLTSFDGPVDVDDFYADRVRGFLYPPRTGEYTFWIASDNGSELWLSTDEDPRHARKIATVDGRLPFAYTAFHGWDQNPVQKSAQIHLEADKRYYIEALHVEVVGQDSLSVAWEGPGISRTVIDGAYLSPPNTSGNAPESDQSKRGTILREYWLDYPLSSGPAVDGLRTNPPTRFGKPTITEVSLTPITRDTPPPAAQPITIEQPWPEALDYRLVEVDGVVSQISDLDNYWTVLRLTDQGCQMKARLANPGHEKMESWLNARVKVRGFCEGALTANSGRVASVVWVPDVRDIAVIPPAGDDWERLPRISVRDLNSASSAARVGQRIRVAGECKEVMEGEILIRDPDYLFSAYISKNGQNWSQVASSIEMPMNHSVYAGIATYGSNACTARYDSVCESLFPGRNTDIGSPKAPGSALGDATHLVVTGTGDIAGRGYSDYLMSDRFSFYCKRMEGDGEVVARIASIADVKTGGSGLMIRESLEGRSRMFYLVCSPETGIDVRVRQNTGDAIQGFAYGDRPPFWLKLVRQSAHSVRVRCSQIPALAPHQLVEVMGVLGHTNQEWVLSGAFCRIPPATAGTNASRQSQTEFTTVRQIRQLGADELKLGRPAQIEGVITAEADGIYVQDNTGGIRIPSIVAQKFAGFEVGQRLRIAGRSVPGGLSPILEPIQQADSVRLLGRGRMPQPVACTWSQLMLGRQDSRWVEVRGVVRRIEGRALKLQMPGGDIAVSLDFDLPKDKGGSLIDSTVRVEGVCRMTVNEKKQLTGVQLIVPKAEFIVVDEASPADPFAVAPQPINRLLQFGEQAELVHRVKIQGAVTYCHNGVFYIQDATGGIEVASGARTFEPGDRVEVLGFPESTGSTVNLVDALIRKAGSGALPEPVKLGGDLPQAAHASRLVAMKAIFLGHSTLLDSDVLQLQNGNRIFQGMLPKQRGALPELEPGSLLHLTGVCRLVKNAAAEASKSDPDFELLLCAPSNVVLLEAPPWWNWRRLLWVGGIFIGVVTVAGTWIAMILRKNRLLKQAHQELRKAADELEIRVEHRTADLAKASAELERFTYTVSHDLKSPLVTVKTFLGYLERDLAGSDKDKVKQDIAYIHTAAEKMGQLLDELLNLARVGRKMNPPERVTFRDLTQEVIKLVAGRISTGGVQVQVTDANVVLEGDRQRLMEVWQNLLENACKFMGKQSQPQVEIGVEQRGPETVFFVRDNGMGIDPCYQAKVFGLFEKLDPKAEGTGMGLSLVKRIVELYKGRIWVESAGTGQGANFLFTLPGAVMLKAE